MCKTDHDKDIQEAYQEYIKGIEELKNWGQENDLKTRSSSKIAQIKLVEMLGNHRLYQDSTDGIHNYKVWAKNPIELPLPSFDKGFYDVDCTADISQYDIEHLANLLLRVSNRSSNSFMQQMRRRLSILERPLVTARGSGKSYIYSNFK